MIADLKYQAILAVEKNKEELLHLCSKLIQFPSENPVGNSTPISHYIADYLKQYEIDTDWYEAGQDMWNLIAKVGNSDGKMLIYCGHTDVVPAGDLNRWDFNPFSGEIKDGWMLGRGASDMKAGLAGIIFATTVLKRLDISLPGELCLAIVPDEETGGELGVPWLLERGLVKGDGCLIAEPSSPLNPTLGQKGSLWFKLTVYGEQAHGSLGPIAGKNAITDTIKAIEKIAKVWHMEITIPEEVKPIIEISKKYMSENERSQYMHILEKVSINVGTIKGGTKSNMVPDTCAVEIDCRLPFGITKEEVLSFIHDELSKLGITYEIEEFGFRSNANYTAPEDPVCEAIVNNIKFVTGQDAYGVMQWASSDARHFRKYDIPVLQYGPAYLPSIHNFNEKVPVEDIIRCAKVYVAAAIDFLYNK
ncbi:M20 family metallopeptidase [Alkalihalobacillus sp. BA299]|uniref:M20 family metallopeptidase n=1 Tax=Alkalihalobacillus sp. BA299 TaxID=2815938 RepID=UPI001ADD45F3|nr:ArgE/DapE family deacylase [Alkalihalobacillus sp. BA299]